MNSSIQNSDTVSPPEPAPRHKTRAPGYGYPLFRAMLFSVVGMFLLGLFHELPVGDQGGWTVQIFYITLMGSMATAGALIALRQYRRLYQKHVETVAESQHTGDVLRAARDELEKQIHERTAELNRLNSALRLDIIQRQKIETDLRNSERRYREMADLLPLAIFECDTDGRLTFVNRQALEVFGYGPEDLHETLLVPDMVVADDRARTLENMRRTLLGERKIGGNEYRGLKKDGTVFDIIVETAAVVHDGKLAGMRGVVVDISEHKQHSRKQKEDLQFLQYILDTLPNPVFFKDADLRYQLVNNAFAEIIGRPRDQIIGRRVDELVPPEIAEQFMQRDRFLMSEPGSVTEENVFTLGTKSDRNIVSHCTTYVDTDGKPAGIIAVFQDVTEYQQAVSEVTRAHETMRNLIQTAPLPIISVNFDGTVADVWNPAAERMFGWPAEKAIGRSLPIIPETGREKFAQLTEQLRNGHTFDGEAINPVKWDGTPVSCSLYATPIRNTEGVITGSLAMIVDETESKRNEQALRESEERFRNLADTAPVLMWMAGADRHCYYFNKMWLQFTGRRLQVEYGRGWLGGVHPEDREYVITMYQNAFRSRQSFVTEFRLLHADGTYHWLLDRGTPRTTPDGNFTGFIGTCTDISDIKSAEVALRESEERLRAVFTAAQDPIFIKNLRREYVQVNPATAQSFSIPEARIIGRTDEEISAPEVAAQTRAEDHRVFAGEIIESELHETINGKLLFHHVIKVPLQDHDGRIIGLCGIARDITERKQTEQTLASERQLFIAGPIVVFRWNAEVGWPVEYVSPNIRKEWGYSPDEFTVKKRLFSEIMHPDDVQRTENQVNDYVRRQVPHYELEYRIRHADGGYRWIREYTVVVRNLHHEVTHFHGYCLDITERRQAELELQTERNLFIAGPTIVYRWQVDELGNLCVNYISPNIQTVFGYLPQDFVERRVIWEALVHPEDRDRIIGETAHRIQTGAAAWEQEYRARIANGEYRWVHDISVANRNEQGHIVDYSAYMIDVTERRHAQQALIENEKRFRMMTDNAHDVMWTTDRELQITYVNPAVQRLIGYTQEEVLRLGLEILLTETSLQMVREMSAKVLAGYSVEKKPFETTWRGPMELRHKNGSPVWVEAVCDLLLDENGQISQFVGVGRKLDSLDAAVLHESGTANAEGANADQSVSKQSIEALHREMKSAADALNRAGHDPQRG